MGIDHALARTLGVVGADGLPSIAMRTDVLRQNPGTNMRVEAWIDQCPTVNAMGRQHAQPATIDLHMPEIFAAVAIHIPRKRIPSGFNL